MRFFLVFCFFSLLQIVQSQDLTGFWKSDSEVATKYYAEMHMIKGADGAYYGHSFDRENDGFCRHWFKATFSNVYFTGKDNELIDKTPDHSATLYNLRYVETPDGEYLIGETSTYSYEKVFNNMGVPTEEMVRGFPNFVRLKKVNNVYKPYSKEEFPDPVFPDPVAEIVPEPPLAPLPPKVEPKTEPRPVPLPPKEELAKAVEKKALEEKEKEDLTALKLGRKEKLVSSIRLKSAKIRLEIKDFGTEDNDTVTIFLNDSILAKKIQISRKADVFEFELPKNRKDNKLVFVANNLGDIPPNSAEIRLWIDDKEYYYKLFTDDKYNAVVRLDILGVRQKE